MKKLARWPPYRRALIQEATSEPSLLLLKILARQIDDSRRMILLTSREAGAAGSTIVTETLAQLSRLPAFRRHSLSGLEIEDVHRFFKAEAEQEPDADLVQSLHAHTEGNPFFLAEVIRLPESQGGSGASGLGGELGLPQGVRDVVGQRLRRLSDQCNLVLTTASIVGREFDFGMLGIVMEDVSEIELLDVVDEALEAHLVEATLGPGDRYQFTHALVQQTLSENLSASRKVRLHARIGEVLEEMHGDRPELGRGSLLQFEPKFFDDWVGQQLLAHLGHGALGFGAVGLVDIDQQVFADPHVVGVFEAEAMEAGKHSDALRVVHRGLKGNVDTGLVHRLKELPNTA